MAPLGLDMAVNVHHGRDQLEPHLAAHELQPHVSVEPDEALGTAGALARLRGWLGGRAALVVNADGVTEADLSGFLTGWDGERVRLLLVGGGPLQPTSLLVASIVPWARIAGLDERPTGLYEQVFLPAGREGQLDVAAYDGLFVDCGTPADYLKANLVLSGGEPVVDERARVEGVVEESVVWPDAEVRAGEVLRRAIRVNGRMTVIVR
jgi:NDP-sugar pyrophosphorylase family protein